MASLARIEYEACPLCGDLAITDLTAYNCTKHPLYRPPLPDVMRWCECFRCKHVFTDGYFGPDALEVLFSGTPENQRPGQNVEASRNLWAGVVERVAQRLPTATGRWLDVGFGDGGLLACAQEWGFDPLGIDLRPDTVAALASLGIPARCAELEAVGESGAWSVVSMCDVLEHMPFPPRALAHVRTLLAPGGVLFLSMPNLDTLLWRQLDRDRRNPYWIELEHYHNFSRARLYALLREHGFEPEWYGVNRRYLCGMEVIARRLP
jgi:SAM-dependent methyltransferase